MKNKMLFVEGAVIVILLVAILYLLNGNKKADNNVLTNAVEGEIGQSAEAEKEETSGEAVSVIEAMSEEFPEEVPYPIKDITGDNKVNIVVFGDSIWDDMRGEDGVSEQVEALTGAKVYNCAIGGTSAALINENTEYEEWDTRSVNGMLYIARGNIAAESQLNEGEAALSDFQSIEDYNTIDYFIFSYGLNDYFSGVPLSGDNMYDMTSYFGSLRHAADMIVQAYPQSKVIMISPTYCLMDGGDSDTVNTGEGTLPEYADMMGIVSSTTMEKSYYIDAYHNFGINADNVDTMLDDGIHLSSEGRKLYAEKVALSLSQIIPE